MAKILKDNAKMEFPLQIKRQDAFHLDPTSAWYSLEEAQEYAKSNPTAPVGQVISVIDEEKQTVDVYKITHDGELEGIGGATAGDDKSITLTDGILSLVGFNAIEAAGMQLRTVAKDGGGFTIEWFKPDTSTVAGLQETVGGLQSDVTSLKSDVGELQTEMEGLDTKIAETVASYGHLTKKKVDQLPDVGTADENTIYMVPDEAAGDQNNYIEYMVIDGAWEKIGESKVDLSGYATTEAMNEALEGKVDAVEGSRLMTEDEGAKLESIQEGATKVEWGSTNGALKINGEEQNVYEPEVDGKTITKNESGVLSVAEGVLGVKVVSSDEDNKIKFNEDGTGEINRVDVQKLFVAEGDELILNGGNAASIK